MNRRRWFRLLLIALIPAAICLCAGNALAQAPAPSPAAPAKPEAAPAPAPASPPAAAETPATPPAVSAPVQTADPFGEQITLEPKTVVVLKGSATWDSAFDTLIDSFKSLAALLDK